MNEINSICSYIFVDKIEIQYKNESIVGTNSPKMERTRGNNDPQSDSVLPTEIQRKTILDGEDREFVYYPPFYKCHICFEVSK